MNKSIVITLLAALIIAACTSTPKSYIIEGIVPDSLYNNQMAYMFDIETLKKTDSTFVVDGKFTFSGSVDTPAICRLNLKKLYAEFILENGYIYIDMADPERPESVKGTPMNDDLSKYRSELFVYHDIIRKKFLEIQNLEGDIHKQANELIEQYMPIFEQLGIKYFDENKNNILGAYILWNGPFVNKPKLLDSLLMQAGNIVRNFRPFRERIERDARIKQTSEGMLFIDFIIENGALDGSRVSFSDYVGKGKYVLVDFWASWCGPCIAEIPVLVEVYNKYKGDKFDVLGVAVMDKREASLKSLETHNIPWPQIIDTNDIPMILYGISGIPHIILFGPDGKIVARNLRGDQLKAKVAEVMQ